MSDSYRIANCSGFYGDRLSAAKEMVDGGPIDCLTGDYLAELTMLILLKDKMRDKERGYARTFLRQLQQVARDCAERDIKIVVNAGGMNPSGLADAAERLYEAEGLDATVAWIDGDDLLPRLDELMGAGETLDHLDRGIPLEELEYDVLSANAYLGAWGIVEALNQGADLVVCPRVTDASVVVGPAAWKFGWARDDWDQLASAVVAGHIIECGAQTCGGNYSFFKEVPSLVRPGFPIACMDPDGSFVITKHEGTDGEVTVGTVTAQLLYEIQGTRYMNPDVVVCFDTIKVTQEGEDRVRVHGIKGEPAPESIKVCMNYLGGYKNSTTYVLPGLDIEEKAKVIEDSFWEHVGGREQFQETRTTLRRGSYDGNDAFALFTIAARDPDEEKVGRKYWNAAIEMALGNYPGFQTASSSRTALAVTVYWPCLVSADQIHEKVHLADRVIDIEQTATMGLMPASFETEPAPEPPSGEVPGGPIREAKLGAVLGSRSGDKGGNANVGFFARSEKAYLWMADFLTPDVLRELYPEAKELEIDRYELPNILSLNFVIRGLLGEGVSASLRPDPQAKMVGEELRGQTVSIPVSLLS